MEKEDEHTWPSLNFSKHITHFELVASDCADMVLSASLMLPVSSLVCSESDDPLLYFLVSILDKACKAILVREDYIEETVKINVTFVMKKKKKNKLITTSNLL